MDKPFKHNDFCTITTDGLQDQQLNMGDIVYIAGEQLLQKEKDDPYTFRKYFIVHPMFNGKLVTSLFLMIDPTSIKKVPAGKQKRLEKKMLDQFGEADGTTD